MGKKVLIVEDQFVEANDLQLMLTKAGYNVSGIARSVTIAQKMLAEEKPDLVLLDIFLKGKQTGIDLAKQLKESNIAFIFISANSNEEILSAAKTTEPYGFIVKPFREKDLLVTLEIAQYRYENSIESKFRREAELHQKLEQTITTDNADWKKKLLKIGMLFQQHFPFDYFTAGFNKMKKISFTGCSFLRIGFNEYQTLGIAELATITGLSSNILTTLISTAEKETSAATVFNDEAFENLTGKLPLKKLFKETFQLRSHLALPLQLTNGEQFSICFYSRQPQTYQSEHIDLFQRLRYTLTTSIERLLLAEKTGTATSENNEVPVITDGFKVEGFEGVIGNSPLLLTVFDNITQVAPFDTSVLILGESGTGKERVADYIHGLSPRKGKAFVKVNCAALPASLIESELFGHEKGSFTGAIDKRIGKFEQAQGGTIFLDEIGEMPLDMQVKLLRVLQEKEIEPIGGKATIKINVRIIAATNRNLEKEVADGRFRLDLYYRLNIFPIQLPPLRERKEDLPAFTDHFIATYSRKAGKKISGVSQKVINKLNSYTWPGNIRELENLIERSVLLAKGQIIEDIDIPVSILKDTASLREEMHTKTICENERDYILSVLKKTNSKIWGAGGAAELLNIPPTTLTSKMKKLGIKKTFIE